MNFKKLERKFYLQDTLDVAKKLLGKLIVHNSDEGKTIGKIVETESYIGPNDAASHAYMNKRTKRTEVQFGIGGFAYIYLIYGMYYCFNIVTAEINKPEVVLIRALEPIEGIPLMKNRRSKNKKPIKLLELMNGPGKLCTAMAINNFHYGIDLCGDKLFLVYPEKNEKLRINTTPRINIEYAGSDKDLLWRFTIKENKFVSK